MLFLRRNTLPETNSSNLKIDGLETILSFWGPLPVFRGEMAVSCREGIFVQNKLSSFDSFTSESANPNFVL